MYCDNKNEKKKESKLYIYIYIYNSKVITKIYITINYMIVKNLQEIYGAIFWSLHTIHLSKSLQLFVMELQGLFSC